MAKVSKRQASDTGSMYSYIIIIAHRCVLGFRMLALVPKVSGKTEQRNLGTM